jgi:hypothetical protein
VLKTAIRIYITTMDAYSRDIYSSADSHINYDEFHKYSVTHVSACQMAEIYASDKAELNKSLANVKRINTLQTKIMNLTQEARDAIFYLVKEFLKNEMNNVSNARDLSSITQFFNEHDNFDNVWYLLYKEHSNNSMIQKIVDFLLL